MERRRARKKSPFSALSRNGLRSLKRKWTPARDNAPDGLTLLDVWLCFVMLSRSYLEWLAVFLRSRVSLLILIKLDVPWCYMICIATVLWIRGFVRFPYFHLIIFEVNQGGKAFIKSTRGKNRHNFWTDRPADFDRANFGREFFTTLFHSVEVCETYF